MKIEPGYEPVAEVLQAALNQTQLGKGRLRHANNKPFMEQPIMTGARECGPGGLAFQARKKILEALNCPDDNRAIEDFLGAIVYTAALVLLRREQGRKRYPSVDEMNALWVKRLDAAEEETLRQEAPGRSEYQTVKPGGAYCRHKKAVKIDPAENSGYTARCLVCGVAFNRTSGYQTVKPDPSVHGY